MHSGFFRNLPSPCASSSASCSASKHALPSHSHARSFTSTPLAGTSTPCDRSQPSISSRHMRAASLRAKAQLTDIEEEFQIPDYQADVEAEALAARNRIASHDSSLQTHVVQWYPGHIARAERMLKEHLKMVDAVLEIWDARIPVSTCHPQVPTWCGNKLRLQVMNRVDQISEADRAAWVEHFKATGQKVYWTDGKLGNGVKGLKSALLAAANGLNAKREKRGLKPRSVRACVIGFPNIGKSALINRLLGRRVVASAPKPGVTRGLQWVRLSGQLDMLDAPGVIPASFVDQVSAQRLAICNDIGEAAYIDSLVAAAFVVRCKALAPVAPTLLARLVDRYGGLDPLVGTGEDYVQAVGDRLFLGDREKAAARILKDFRTGVLGPLALELPADAVRKVQRERKIAIVAVEAAAARAASDGFSTGGQ